MIAALRGHYVQFVVFMGMMEAYPDWFIEEIANRAFIDESRYCFWTSPPERPHDYYEKELIETYSIIVRKESGETQVMEYGTFEECYKIFQFNYSNNGGVAAFNEDWIEYVECIGGALLDVYPQWFYEYFTESLNNPKESETYLFGIDGHGHITVKERCVFLRNRFGEIRQMLYADFLNHYDPRIDDKNWWEECPF
jgi:hypothetical protein